MNSTRLESQSWTRGRWWVIVGMVLSAQAGLIFWLAGHGAVPLTPASPPRPPGVFRSANSNAEVVGSDPTFFVRANQRGYSGPAWMHTPSLAYDEPKWTDSSPPSNELRVQELGGTLQKFLKANLDSAIQLTAKPEPELSVVAPDDPLANVHSALTIEGALANRPLHQPLKLEAWSATETAEILSNSTVQACVDSDGNVFSAVLLAGSGSKEADASALALTRAARFESLRRRTAGEANFQTWGQLVFHWRTLPSPVTNNLPLSP